MRSNLAGGISNIQLRWVKTYRSDQVWKWVEKPIIKGLNWPTRRTLTPVENRIPGPPKLQYQFFSETTKEWTPWYDVPVVEENAKYQASDKILKLEYPEDKNKLFKLDL